MAMEMYPDYERAIQLIKEKVPGVDQREVKDLAFAISGRDMTLEDALDELRYFN